MDHGKASNFSELMRQHEFHVSLSDITEEDLESERSSIFIQSSAILRGLLCSVLEDVKSQLKCLKGQSYKIRNNYRNLDVPTDSLDELIKLIRNPDESIILYTKLDADRNYVYGVIQEIYLELKKQNTFAYLKESIRNYVDLENYRYDLAQDKERNKIIRRNLGKQLKVQRCHIKVQIHDINGTIERLERTIDDSQPMFETKRRYIKNWQVAQTEQHNLIIVNKENIPRSSINRFKEKYEHEIKVHGDVERLTAIQINDTLSEIEVFMDKYDKDLENMELKIQIRKNNCYDICKKGMEMEEMLKKREAEMNDWSKFKEEREIVRMYKEKMTNAAFTIQAWWRGLLVRLQLGRFQEKKKKKKNLKK